MAKKKKTVYVCQACGYESSGWMGRCPSCNAWNSFVEEQIQEPAKASNQHGWIDEQMDALGNATRSGSSFNSDDELAKLRSLNEISGRQENASPLALKNSTKS